jgi:hypothetical protein
MINPPSRSQADMHTIHHVPGFMQTRNFNLTFPICDALFGTSDLDRGLVGTLFNGNSNKHMRRDLLPTDPNIPAPQFDGRGIEPAKAA